MPAALTTCPSSNIRSLVVLSTHCDRSCVVDNQTILEYLYNHPSNFDMAVSQVAKATPVFLLILTLLLISIKSHPEFNFAERHVILTGIYSSASAILAHNACHLVARSSAEAQLEYSAQVYCFAPAVGTAAVVAGAYVHSSGGYGPGEWEFIGNLPNRTRQFVSNRLGDVGATWPRRDAGAEL